MPHLKKLTHVVIPVNSSLLNLLTIFITFLIYIYSSLVSFTIALIAKQTNISLLNLIMFLLLYHSMKLQPTLTIDSLWTLKDPFLLPRKETLIFVSLSVLLAILFPLTLIFICRLIMQFKHAPSLDY